MPVGLSLFISLIVAFGFFATLFGLVILIVEGRRTQAAPRMGVTAGSGKGVLNIWVNWDPSQFNVEVYRLRFQHITPNAALKEGTFTVTFNEAQTAPFLQPVEIPARVMSLVEGGEKGIFTVDFKSVHETTQTETFTFARLRKIFAAGANAKKTPKIANVLSVAQEDTASVFSLDFEELQERRTRLKALEDAAKAKAAKAAAAAAAKPAAATATAAPAPVLAAATPPPAAQPTTAPKSVREVVSQANAKPADKPASKT